MKISKTAWSMLMQHANYDKALVQRSVKAVESTQPPHTLQHILTHIWNAVDPQPEADKTPAK